MPLRHILPTIEALVKNRNKLIVVSFFEQSSLAVVAGKIAETLGRKFIDLPQSSPRLPEYDIPHLYFVRDAGLLSRLPAGDIALVENLNLLSEAEMAGVAGKAQVFVNDDFSADSSRVKLLQRQLPATYGLLAAAIKSKLNHFRSQNRKPMVLLLGGVTLEDKEVFIDKLMARADHILAGGEVANLFLSLRGYEIGKSSVGNKNTEKFAKQFLRDYGHKIKLPKDIIVAATPEGPASCKNVDQVRPKDTIWDIGPQTILEFSKYIKLAKTLVWCGAFGRVEMPRFRHGTSALLRLAASRTGLPDTIFAASGPAVLKLLDNEELFDDLDLVLPRSATLLQALTD